MRVMRFKRFVEVVGVNPSTVFRWAQRGLPFVRVTGISIYISIDDAIHWLDQQENMPRAKDYVTRLKGGDQDGDFE